MVLSISLWNEYSSLSHTLMMALQGGDKELASETIRKLDDVMAELYGMMDVELKKDEQYEGLSI